MATMIAVPKDLIENILSGNLKLLFWKNLPMKLTLYSSANSYIFNDNNTKIYMCCDNEIKLSANIAAIYNLQYKQKTSPGIQIINARTQCIDVIYKDWKKTPDNNEKPIDCEEFYEYLTAIGFYNNYAILLKNVKYYVGE